MAKVKKIPESADFYYQLALAQKDDLLYYDAVLNINEAIRLEPDNAELYSLKAEILALNDDEIQSNELYFFIQRQFNIDKSISLASNFIRFGREELIHYYFRKGIETAIELGQETEDSPGILQRIIKDLSNTPFSPEDSDAELPSFEKYEEIIELERDNFINVKDKREAAHFAKMLSLMDASDFFGAIRVSEKIPASSKYYQDALELRMNIMFYIKDLRGAFLCAEKLSALAPCNVSMFTVYASLYDELANKDMSKHITQKVNKALEILLAEAEYDEIFAIAEIFFENNAFLPCAKLLEKYVEGNPVREETLLMLAVTLFALNRKKDTIRLLKRTYDLYSYWTCAPTIAELLLSDYEIGSFNQVLATLPDKFAQARVKALLGKIKGAIEGYYSIDKEELYEQIFSLAKLSDEYTIKPILDILSKQISNPVFKGALDMLLTSDMVYWEDKKSCILKSILEHACKERVYFEGAIVIDGLYSSLFLPLRLDIDSKDNKEKFNYYYRQAILNILRAEHNVDGKLVARIVQDVYKSTLKNGFNPKSETCLIQIICIIYKMTKDGASFEKARNYTENSAKCQLKTLKRYRDILNIEALVQKFIKK